MERKLLKSKQYSEEERKEFLDSYSEGLAQIPPRTIENHWLDAISDVGKVEVPEKIDRIQQFIDKAQTISLLYNIGMDVFRYEDVLEIIFYPGKTALFKEFSHIIRHMDEGVIQISPDTGRLEIHCILTLYQYESDLADAILEGAQRDFLNYVDLVKSGMLDRILMDYEQEYSNRSKEL